MIVNDTRIVSGIGARQDRRHIIRQTAAGVSKGNRVALDTGDAVARTTRNLDSQSESNGLRHDLLLGLREYPKRGLLAEVHVFHV